MIFTEPIEEELDAEIFATRPIPLETFTRFEGSTSHLTTASLGNVPVRVKDVLLLVQIVFDDDETTGV
jgi:hypothetical protein